MSLQRGCIHQFAGVLLAFCWRFAGVLLAFRLEEIGTLEPLVY